MQMDKITEGCNLLIELSERGTEDLRGKYLFIVSHLLPELASKHLGPCDDIEALDPVLTAELRAGRAAEIDVDTEGKLGRGVKQSQLKTVDGGTIVRPRQLCRPCVRPPYFKPELKVMKHEAWSQEITVSSTQLELIQPKFEPPWVYRSNGSIQFTEAMIDQQLSLTVSSASGSNSNSSLYSSGL
jgi:hypothetical protein